MCDECANASDNVTGRQEVVCSIEEGGRFKGSVLFNSWIQTAQTVETDKGRVNSAQSD